LKKNQKKSIFQSWKMLFRPPHFLERTVGNQGGVQCVSDFFEVFSILRPYCDPKKLLKVTENS